MDVVIDTETNALRGYTRLWCIVCREVDTGKTHVFREPDCYPEPFIAFANGVSLWIGHNIVGFDHGVLAHFFPNLLISRDNIRDTLVLSRLVCTSMPGGHSLEAWGDELGYPKDLYDDFSCFSEELVQRCVRDTEINAKIWTERLGKYCSIDRWKKSIDLEHYTAFTCQGMTRNGFYFDIQRAKSLYTSVSSDLVAIDSVLESAFPEKPVLVREITPKGTKYGTISAVGFKFLGGSPDLTPYTIGAPFSLIKFQQFNPRSPSQIVDRLNGAGWSPVEKTKGHIAAERAIRDRRGKSPEEVLQLKERLEHFKKVGWTVSETNLATLPPSAPEGVKQLATRLVLESRRSDLEEWLNLYDKGTGRIHGHFFGIGAWTHRMAHHTPNTANIASPIRDTNGNVLFGSRGLYGADLRQLWRAYPGKCLVGVDADGIQLRVLAHHMDDRDFTTALVSGDKKLKTDAHSLNGKALGDVCKDRDTAKTFIYAWLLGAGIPKIAQILECTKAAAKEACERFLARYSGLKKLKEVIIPKDARRGCFEALDKRLIVCDNEHKMLAGYLQSGEAIIMKLATRIWKEQLDKENVPYWLVNFVHDEWVIETLPEFAQYVKEAACNAITQAGEQLDCKCPMQGTGRIGDTWFSIH